MNTSTDLLSFYDHVKSTCPELVKSFNDRIVEVDHCPICIETKPIFNAAMCSNNHMAACESCRMEMMLNSSFEDKCPICRCAGVITNHLPTDVNVCMSTITNLRRRENDLVTIVTTLRRRNESLVNDWGEYIIRAHQLSQLQQRSTDFKPDQVQFINETSTERNVVICNCDYSQLDGYVIFTPTTLNHNIIARNTTNTHTVTIDSFRKSTSWLNKQREHIFIIERRSMHPIRAKCVIRLRPIFNQQTV